MHFWERDVYIHVLLFFRRHGLSGSLDNLGQFREYIMSPCRILGPMTLFQATCKKLLYLAGFDPGPKFRFRERSIDPWGIQSPLDLFRMMSPRLLFLAAWASGLAWQFLLHIWIPCGKTRLMSIKLRVFRRISIFGCGSVIPVIQGDVDRFSKYRTRNLFLEKPIFRGFICRCSSFRGSIFSSLYI